MERIFRAIDNNPEATHYKIVDKAGVKKGAGHSDDPETLKDDIETDLGYLEDGTYRVMLGKGNALTDRSATVTLDYRKGEQRGTGLRPASGTGGPGRVTQALGTFTLEDLKQAKEEGLAEGMREARLLRLEDKQHAQDRRMDKLEDALHRLVKMLDEADGEKDGKFGDTALDVLEKVSAAKDLMKNFNI